MLMKQADQVTTIFCVACDAIDINSLHTGLFFMPLLLSADFAKLTFSKNSSRNKIRVSKGLEPDQDQGYVVLLWVQAVCNGYWHRKKATFNIERGLLN